MSAPSSTLDEPLMLAYAAGDARAFEQPYDWQGMRVCRYIFRSLRDRAMADELTQNVWLRVARHAGLYQPGAARAALTLGAAVDSADEAGRTALMWAVRRGEIDLVRLLLDAGARPDRTDNMGFGAAR